MIVVFLVREIRLSPAAIGVLSMIGLLGAIAASAFTERLSRWVGDARAQLVAAIGLGLAFLLQPLTIPGWALSWCVGSTLLAAICIIVGYILQVSTRRRVCPPELQGHVSATMSFVSWGALPIGSLLGGTLGTAFGLRPTLWIAGVATLLGTSWLIFSPYRTLRSVDESTAATPGEMPPEKELRSWTPRIVVDRMTGSNGFGAVQGEVATRLARGIPDGGEAWIL